VQIRAGDQHKKPRKSGKHEHLALIILISSSRRQQIVHGRIRHNLTDQEMYPAGIYHPPHPVQKRLSAQRGQAKKSRTPSAESAVFKAPAVVSSSSDP